MKISKKDYLSLANSIVKCYNINLRNPLNISIYNNTLSFDDAVYFFTKIISWKYTHNGVLLGSEVVTALYNYDYSKEENALITTTTQPFTINATYTKNNNETYELTLTPSETCTIYYTRNGTTPTTKDKIYTSPLTIYNSTWIQYYGVNKNNQKTPILSFGIYRPATAYITNKPQQKNQYERIVNIATSKKSTIYYTINGTKPTTDSTKYTKPITINNYTILQYFSITQEGKKSSTYYYKLQDPTPYTTIINTTELRDNHQIVIVIANKPGTIYYTRNGTQPTTQSKEYTPGTEMNLSIKTELRTILVDKKGQQSIVNFYKAPQIMTPPITIITPKTMLVNNKQTIQFTTNMANSTIYYTTDNTNPKNSQTRKTAKTGNQITISKNTQLKYYTENDGYHSEVYTYTPPQNNNQRPTIAVYNTTRMYSNGEQRIMIQSNQPGTIYYTIYTKTETPITNEYTDEITIDKDQKIQIYAENTENTKKSKMIEYTIQNKSKTIMNYTYTIRTSNTYPAHTIEFIFNGRRYQIQAGYIPGSIPVTRNVYIDIENNEIDEYYYTSTIDKPGILISMGRRLNITYYDILYGETSKVNVVYSSTTNGKEDLTVFTNYKKLITLTIVPATNQNETITTEFKTNNNIITKQETLTYTPQKMTSNCGQYDLLQTYILTNNIITSNTLNTTMNEIDQLYINDTANYIFRITPQDRTIIEGVMFLAMMHSYSDYVAQKLNTTRIINDEVMCMVGIENSRMNYIHYNDPLTGMTIKDDKNIIMFNMYQSMFSYNCAKFVLNTVKYNIATTTRDEIIGLLKLNSEVNLFLENETGILEMHSNLTKNVSMILDLKTGIMTYILCIDEFEYKGAITENLTPDIINQTDKNKVMTECFEDRLSSDFIDKTKNLLGIPLDSEWTDLEDMIGGILIDIGTPIFMSGTVDGIGFLIGGGMILAGSLLCADANGWTTDMNNMSRAL